MTDLFEQPTRRAARRQNKGKKRLRTAFIIMVSLALAVSAGFWAYPKVKDIFDLSPDDYAGPGSGEVVIEIVKGSSGTDIADLLLENGVVASKDAALAALTDNPESSRIQAGAYRLMLEMPAKDAVAWLLVPANRVEISITIPEGFTYWQVVDRMTNADVFGFSKEAVEAAMADTAAIGLPEEAGGEIEGWLAPATYTFVPSATPEDVLSAMIAKTVSNLSAAEVPSDQWQGTLIRASIVQKEGLPPFFGEIARVIDNRLVYVDAGTVGLLQMDSTVNYGLRVNGGVPSQEDLAIDTPFNTYMHKGLPPTPIGAPSIEAIKAVLNPPEGDWFYFVTVDLDTGETLFAETKEEHDANVQLLREWRDAHPSNTTDAEDDE